MRERKLKLLYAFPEPMPLPRARGVQVAHAVTSLAANGVAIDLAYVPVGNQSPLAPADGALPADVALLPLSRGWPAPLDRIPPFSRWHSARFFSARLQQAVKASRPDALYIRHLKLAALLLRRRELPPIVYEAHEVFADTVATKRQARTAAMEGTVMRHAAAVVCNSYATADRLVALYGPIRRLLVLPNGVTRPAALPAKDWRACKKHVVYAGSFFGWKGVADLVTAAGVLDGFHITLIGGDREQLARMGSPPGAGGAAITLLPRLPHAEIMAHLAEACIAVLPNRPEPDSAFTSPIKLFEYMAAGCAVVASDLPSIREVLAPDEAAWFSPGDPADLANALRRLGEDCGRARAMGERLREKSAHYTWDGRAVRLADFLGDVLDA